MRKRQWRRRRRLRKQREEKAEQEQVQAKEEQQEQAKEAEEAEEEVVVVAAAEEQAEEVERSGRAWYKGVLSAHIDCMVCCVTGGFLLRLFSDIAHSDNSRSTSRWVEDQGSCVS